MLELASISEVAYANAIGAVNVRKFGAVGDGVTDDTVAIAAAYAAAVVSGGSRRLFFPPGTYLTDPLIVSHQAVEIFGDGMGENNWMNDPSGFRPTILKSRTGDTVIEATGGNVSELNIHDLAIDGNDGSGHGIYLHDFGSWLFGALFCRFKRLSITSCGGSAIKLGAAATFYNDCYNWEIEDVFTAGIGESHITGYRCFPTCSIRNVYLSGVAQGFYGIELLSFEGTISNANISGNGNGGYGTDPILGTTQCGCIKLGKLGSDYGQANGVLSGIDCESWTGKAIEIYGYNSSVAIQGARFVTPVVDAADPVAVYISTANFPTILSNLTFNEASSVYLQDAQIHLASGIGSDGLVPYLGSRVIRMGGGEIPSNTQKLYAWVENLSKKYEIGEEAGTCRQLTLSPDNATVVQGTYAFTPTNGGVTPLDGMYNSSQANGDSVSWVANMPTGIYTARVFGQVHTSLSAALDWTLDGVAAESAQQWDGTPNGLSVLKTFTLKVPVSGPRVLKVTTNGSSGGGSGHQMVVTKVEIAPA